jgi:hypothetical protein
MKKIESIEIRPAENGGHTVRHQFAREVQSKKMGDIGMGRPEPEEHVFGDGQHGEMMGHVAKALGMKKMAKGDCPCCGDA